MPSVAGAVPEASAPAPVAGGTPVREPVSEAPEATPAVDESKSTPEPKDNSLYSAVLKERPPEEASDERFKSVQVVQQPPFLPSTGQTMPKGATANEPIPPLSPPNSANQFVSPWSSHNSNNFMPVTPPYPNDSLPSDRRAGSFGKRRGSYHKGSSRVGWRNVPGGVVGDDGTVIQHGPGQQIQPSPTQGPGSNSQTGLVDYCNLIVKVSFPSVIVVS